MSKAKVESNWVYYEVAFKLTREQLGTCSETSIWDEHILQKAKKNIKKANRLGDKVTKALEKFKGSEISEDKEIKEIKGIITTFSELIGKPQKNLPDNMDDLLELASTVEEEFNDLVARGEQAKATVFMRTKREDGSTWPIISTHMILGNLKANAKIITNQGDKSIFKYKNDVSEILALDVKPVKEFMEPDQDIMRKKDGSRDLCERPISFDRMGKKETAIAISERLPVGTEFGCILRIRKNSPMTEEKLRKLLDFGKNQGFGANRGSGNYGAYNFKLKKVNYNEETFPGWE